MTNSLNVAEVIARAKAKIEAARQAKLEKAALATAAQEAAFGMQRASTAELPSNAVNYTKSADGWEWNPEQALAIQYGVYRKSFCLIGAAGTGKTTTTKGVIKQMMLEHKIPMLDRSTKHLTAGTPGIALISYTRRAVRNLAKQMPEELKKHCITFHKLVEYEPYHYQEFDEASGEYKNKMRFQPARCQSYTLPATLTTIVVDEASMLSVEHFDELLAALPNPSAVQFIFLGDLNQLPPVYGQAILGKALLQYPIVELTRVYRQALESPIIALALAVKDNNFEVFNTNALKLWGAPLDFNGKGVKASGGPITLEQPGRGKVTLHPWKKQIEQEVACDFMGQQLKQWIHKGIYDPEEDLVLCPWNKAFGTDELNKVIADTLAKKNNVPVYEVIAGFQKHYFAVGDKLMIDKMDCIILQINYNDKYLGVKPQPASPHLNRWGNLLSTADALHQDLELTNEQIDAMLASAASIEDRTHEASHKLLVRFLDTGTEEQISAASVINAASFGYAITVHKAQGSECRRVFFLTHQCHAAMCSRELVYTGITRAAEELYIVMPPDMLARAARKPRIKGDTLADKLAFFNSRLQEKGQRDFSFGKEDSED